MNCLIWNVRGIATSMVCIRKLVKSHKLQLLEDPQNIVRLQRQFHFSHAEVICREQIWIFWNSGTLRSLTTIYDEQCSHFKFQLVGSDFNFWFTPVYGMHAITDRRRL